MDRVPGFEPVGWGFESLRTHQKCLKTLEFIYKKEIVLNLTFNDFVDMEAIDHNVGFNSVTPAEICYEQYQKFPNYICVLKNENKVIGYVSTLSLKKEMYEKLKEDKSTEGDIQVFDLDFDVNPAFLYIAAIVVDLPFQTITNVRKIFKNYKKHMSLLIKNGMNIAEVLAECSTKKGIVMAQHFLKMKPCLTTDHGILHCVDGKTFEKIMLN